VIGTVCSALVNGELRRWRVGGPDGAGGPAGPDVSAGCGGGERVGADGGGDDGQVALTAEQMSAASVRPGTVVAFHRAMAGPLPTASGRVDVHLPAYRGKSLVPVLAWLTATRLAAPGAEVVWHLDKQQGPDSIQRLLASLGWRLDQARHGRLRLLSGQAPAAACLPEPRQFTAEIGGTSVRLAADYGVFSPAEIDAGTRLLLDVALRGPSVAALADIGTGYGPLAIGLLASGIAQRAVATDVDCIALWLAELNASMNGITAVEVTCSADPAAAEPTPLTVCNVPTHIDSEQTAALMAGLLRRARSGRLLAVIHASLEARYTRYFTEAGLHPARHPGPHHVVLDSAR
jgi:16S rRNA G1207 methylase RsmC